MVFLYFLQAHCRFRRSWSVRDFGVQGLVCIVLPLAMKRTWICPLCMEKKRILTFNVLQIDVRLAVRLDFTMSFCEECDVRLWVSPEPPYLSARQPRYPGSNMEVIVLLLRPE